MFVATTVHLIDRVCNI